MQNTQAGSLLHSFPTPPVCKALPRDPLGKSDHFSILLLPTYRQKLKQEPTTIREVHYLLGQSDSIHQDILVRQNMFLDASNNNIDEYAKSFTGFIKNA